MEIQESKNNTAVPNTDEKLSEAEPKGASQDVIWEKLERDQKNPEIDNNVQVLSENETHSDNQETQDKSMKNFLTNQNEIDAVEDATTNEDDSTEANEYGSTETLSMEAYEKQETEKNEKDSAVTSASVDDAGTNSSQNPDQPADGVAENDNVASNLDLIVEDEAINYPRYDNVQGPLASADRAARAPRARRDRSASGGSLLSAINPYIPVSCGWRICIGIGAIIVAVVISLGWVNLGYRSIVHDHSSDNSTDGFYGGNGTAIGMANITEFGMDNITDIGMENITAIMANNTTSAASSLVGDYTIWILGTYAIIYLVDCF